MKPIKLFLIGALFMFACAANAQVKSFTTTGLESGTATATVTNTATALLYCYSPGKGTTTTIQFNGLETSGTTAGTVSLLGSLDGVNYRSISATTFTATDVTTNQGIIWIITGAPCLYYAIQWVGSGTMVATFTGSLVTK
jgi:hypothetical protein